MKTTLLNVGCLLCILSTISLLKAQDSDLLSSNYDYSYSYENSLDDEKPSANSLDELRLVIHQVIMEEYYTVLREIVADIVYDELYKLDLHEEKYLSDVYFTQSTPHIVISNKDGSKDKNGVNEMLAKEIMVVVEKKTGNSLLMEKYTNYTPQSDLPSYEIEVSKTLIEVDANQIFEEGYSKDEDFTGARSYAAKLKELEKSSDVPDVKNNSEELSEGELLSLERKEQFDSESIDETKLIEIEEEVDENLIENNQEEKDYIVIVLGAFSNASNALRFSETLRNEYSYKIEIFNSNGLSKVGIVVETQEEALKILPKAKNINNDAWIMAMN